MAEFVTIARLDEFDGRELASFVVGSTRIAVALTGGDYHAFDDTCTHLGVHLPKERSREKRLSVLVTEAFDIITGAVRRGPAQEPVKSYGVRVRDGALQLEL